MGLPVDLHTQGTRPLIFLSPPPPLSALQLLVAEQFTKRAYMCSGASSLLGKRGTPNGPAQAHARRILGKGSMRPYFALFFCQLLSDSSARCLPFKSDLQPQGETNQVLQLFKECKHHSLLDWNTLNPMSILSHG